MSRLRDQERRVSMKTDLKYEDSPSEHLYTNQIKPYHRAPHILIGFPTRYIERGPPRRCGAESEGMCGARPDNHQGRAGER